MVIGPSSAYSSPLRSPSHARYVYVNDTELPQCKNRPIPVLVRAGPVPVASPDSMAWLHGLAVQLDTGEPFEGAQVQILDHKPLIVRTDSTGQFAFAGSAPQGSIRLDVRRVGFAHCSDTLRTPLEPGEGWRVALSLMPIYTGACAIRERVVVVTDFNNEEYSIDIELGHGKIVRAG